ncbi:hypothetical protein GQX74_011353 [Glossina fuscipes]|nr:hypothetical protein GQX74_011353 [Glossina fuscipes]
MRIGVVGGFSTSTDKASGGRRRGELEADFTISICRAKEHGIYVYKAETKKCVPQHPEHKTRICAVWGKVTRLHGNSGAVRARFRRNLPGHAMGHRVRILLKHSVESFP